MLKDLFKLRGIKQKWIAEKIGVSEVTVSHWVQGKATPREIHIKQLAGLLDIPFSQLKMHYEK